MRSKHHFKSMFSEGPCQNRRFMRMERGIGRRGGGRLLEQGNLRVLVLHLINEAPRHGYELIKAIEDLTGGVYAPSPGVIYPTLTMLEELSQLSATTEGTKRLFSITDAGKAALEEAKPVLEAMLARLAMAPSSDAMMPVKRAVENLKTVLRMKLSNRADDPEAMRKAADMIDELVRKIEEI